MLEKINTTFSCEYNSVSLSDIDAPLSSPLISEVTSIFLFLKRQFKIDLNEINFYTVLQAFLSA